MLLKGGNVGDFTSLSDLKALGITIGEDGKSLMLDKALWAQGKPTEFGGGDSKVTVTAWTNGDVTLETTLQSVSPESEADQAAQTLVLTIVFSPEAARPLPGYNGAGGELVTLDALGLGGTKLGGLCHLCRELLSERPQCRIVMLVENACLRQELETAAVWPGACRFAACNSLPFETYRDLLAASSLVICPRGEEADIRPMLECMSCETLLMAPAAAGTVLRPGITMLDFPGEASENRKKVVTHALDHLAELAPIARNGRRAVLEHSDRDRILPDHLKLILEAYGKQGL